MSNFDQTGKQTQTSKTNWLLWLGIITGSLFVGTCMMLPSYIGTGGGGGGKVSSVKANMHTLQTLVETYALEWQGQYPASLAILKADAMAANKDYWKEFANPVTGQSGLHLSYDNILRIQLQNGQFRSPTPHDAGLVLYAPVQSKGKILRYFIYGLDKTGKPLIEKGRNFTLSNG